MSDFLDRPRPEGGDVTPVLSYLVLSGWHGTGAVFTVGNSDFRFVWTSWAYLKTMRTALAYLDRLLGGGR